MQDFQGAKLAILSGERIVTILRDDAAHIPWPGHWDLPGGGREGQETPEACVLRELHEELGLRLSAADLIWRMESLTPEGHRIWFFVAEIPFLETESVRFGDEGQDWRLADLSWFLTDPLVIPRHRERVSFYLETIRTPAPQGARDGVPDG